MFRDFQGFRKGFMLVPETVAAHSFEYTNKMCLHYKDCEKKKEINCVLQNVQIHAKVSRKKS